MVQKLYNSRQQAVIHVQALNGMTVIAVITRRRVRLNNGMQQDLQSVSEEDEMLVMRSELDGLLDLSCG